MDTQRKLDELLALADSLALCVRREPLGGEGGGLCVLKGRRVLFVDTAADLDTRYERTLAAMAGAPEWESRFVHPEIREDWQRLSAPARPS